MQVLMSALLTILNNLYNHITLSLVSVIIITKNQSRILYKCIKSVLKQTYTNFEVIIVDDNSSDNTSKVIKSVKYFLNIDNQGLASLRNFGIEKSKGRYIFFTDSDCMPTKNWIEEGMKILINEKYAGVEGKTIAENQNFGASQHFVENYNGGQYQTCNIAYKRKYLIECDMFNEKYKIAYEDIDLAIRIKKISPIIFNSDMLVLHQLVPMSIEGLISNSYRAKYKVLLIKEHDYKEILNFRILEINDLIKIFFPFLLLFYYRIQTLRDLYFLPFLYLRAVIHRFIVWRTAIKEKILIF